MKARIITSVAAAGALAIGGCSQDLTPTPAVPTEASFSVAPAIVCSFPAIRSSASAYFASSEDPVYALITAMDRAGRLGPAVRTNSGFEVLARLGAAADIGASAVKGTPAQGSTFANSVLGCMVVPTYTGPIDFSEALGPNGLFAVRDNSGVGPVASRLLRSGAPAFGAEPGGPGNWPLARRTLFYGNLLTVPTLAGETPAGDVFDLTTLPSGLTFSPMIKVGVCILTDPNARILHLHATDPGVILPPAPTLSFCGTGFGARGASSSFFASAASHLSSLFVPAPAHAAATSAFKVGGGGTGLVGGLSKIGPVSYTSTIDWVFPPHDTNLSANPQFSPIVTVRNKSANGNALSQATITLVITGNNGNFAVTGNTAVTNFEGTARFPNLKIDTAGDYTVTAVSELGGSVTTSITVSAQ